MLQEPRDEDVPAVGDGIDVDLDALQVAIDADGPIGVDDGGRGELPGEVLGRVAEVDGQAADDERGPDDDRVADPLGEGQGLLHRVGHAAVRLGDAEAVEERREAGPFLGLVDGLEVGAEELDAAGRERRGEVEGRLAAVGHERRQEVLAGRRLGVDDASDALGVEGLEVEASRGVEVGRDGLRVGVDHHRRPAGPPERVGGLDGAVVELDPLPDPDRAAADHERAPGGRPAAPPAPSRPRRRSSRSRASRRRTRRRRCRPSRSPGTRPRARRASRRASKVTPASAASSRSPKPARLTVARSVVALGVRRDRPGAGPRLATSASRATLRPISARNQVCDPGRHRDRRPGARPVAGAPRTRHRRSSDGARKRRRTIGAAVRWAWRVDSQASPPSSIQRMRRVVSASRGRPRARRQDRGQVVDASGAQAGSSASGPAPACSRPRRALLRARPEGPIDGHDLARRLHLAAERPVRGRELVEREARQLDDDVVERRLEGGDGRAGHDVGDLGQPPPDAIWAATRAIG